MLSYNKTENNRLNTRELRVNETAVMKHLQYFVLRFELRRVSLCFLHVFLGLPNNILQGGGEVFVELQR